MGYSKTISGRKYSSAYLKHSRVTKRPAEASIRKKPVIYGKNDPNVGPPPKKVAPQRPASSKVATVFQEKSKVVTAEIEEKKSVETSSTEPSDEGHYELNPLMSKMVEAELKNVMIKIWQSLPDEPVDDAERLVSRRFRNEVGDDLRNTIGLNITKRLLNVHNPLYVKIVFAEKPLRADLLSFIKKHNIYAFKRVSERGGTFAAKVRSFQDFDDLCTNKNLKCGKVRVNVSPCYQFMTCPPNLRTSYVTCYGKADFKPIKHNVPLNKRDTKESNEIGSENTPGNKADVPVGNIGQQKAITTNQESDTPKVTPNKQNCIGKEVPINVTSSKTNQTTTENKVVSKITPTKGNVPDVKNKQVPPNVIPGKPNTDEAEKQIIVTPSKPAAGNILNTAVKVISATTTQQNATCKVTKPESQQQNTASKETPGKPATNILNVAPTATPAKPTNIQNSGPKTTAKPPIAPNTTPMPSTANQNAASKAVPNKPTPTNKPSAAPKVADDQKVTPNATAAKNVATAMGKVHPATKTSPNKPVVGGKQNAPKLIKSPLKSKQTTKRHESDFDELDDHDILALITEGIVLDECSGSEDD